MSIFITDKEGNDHEVFARNSGGMIDAIVRADTKQDWLDAAISRNLIDQLEDEEGNIVLQSAPGVNVDVLGSVQLTSGEYDEEGNEVTAPTFDDRYHVNVRVVEPALSVLDDTGEISWKNTVIQWTLNGQEDTQINASEKAKKLFNVALIDPDTINSPARVWL